MQQVPKFDNLILDLQSEKGVLWITFNRPKKFNAMNEQMYNNVVTALDFAAQSDLVNIVVITGSGKYFSSGNDLSDMNQKYMEAAEIEDGPQKLLEAARDRFSRFAVRFITFPKILVLALNGPCVGIGATIIPHADFVYASSTCTLYTPFTDLGQCPEACSSLTYPSIMGIARANELLLLGKVLTAKEGYEGGLFSAVFNESEFTAKVAERVKLLSEKPPGALLDSKKLIKEKIVPVYLDTNRRECELLMKRWATEECATALMNFSMRKSKL